ncbi:PIN domain-containing protein [Streptomyces sp. NPDC048565]|uniref:PIN domain-containing protein n=1 Tax=Streptomyces sp. NPDC048565 TaxID=3155266 RepID=UPI00341F797D
MIILDTNILKGTSLRGPEAELLRAIRSSRAEQIGAPWIVLEELAAQEALRYEKKYEAARDATEALNKATPWADVTAPKGAEAEDVREHWRRRYNQIVDTLPTSPSAYQTALFREANCLAPCRRLSSDDKTGARDAAIWLTAVAYAREHEAETVYFVSADSDFGDGSSLQEPMSQDIAGLGDRFVSLSSLGDVLTKFATESEVDEEELADLLKDPSKRRFVSNAIRRMHHFSGAVILGPQQLEEVGCWRWNRPMDIGFSSVSDVRAYTIAGHRWYTATVRWLVSGLTTEARGRDDAYWVNCSVQTRVLLSPASKGLTVLRSERPLPITVEDIPDVPAPAPDDPLSVQESMEMLLQRRGAELGSTRDLLERVQREVQRLGGTHPAGEPTYPRPDDRHLSVGGRWRAMTDALTSREEDELSEDE